MEKPGNLIIKPGKTWKFDHKTWKNLEFLIILTLSLVNFDLTQKIYHINKIFFVIIKKFFY